MINGGRNIPCYLCGAPGADSRDHVPARALFYPQRPSDLLTLPAHLSCQQAYAQDEEYTFAFLRQADWENRLEWIRHWQYFSGGSGKSVRRSRPDILRLVGVIQKIVWGLHFYHYRERLSQNLYVTLQLYRRDESELLKCASYTRGTYQEFRYSLESAPESGCSRWTLLLYDRFLFGCQVENN